MTGSATALDPISLRKSADLIGELRKSSTIVIVTHNLQQAARISDSTVSLTIKKAGEPAA